MGEPQGWTIRAHLLFETGERATMPFVVRAADSFEAGKLVVGLLEKLRDDGAEIHLEQLVLVAVPPVVVVDRGNEERT